MLSFELKAGPTEAIAVMNALRLWIRAESLGGVESLVTHPATATHADVPVETRHRLGISDGLIRLSVGLEAAQDLIADLQQALDLVFGTNAERSTNHEVCQPAG
jgi:cystathionine gamma-lyase